MYDKEVAGKRVTLMGLGRHGGGVGAARWLAASGANLSITDQLPAERLKDSLAELAGLPIDALCLGGHDEPLFRSCELLVVNPAVKPDHPLVAMAASAGARIMSEIELFLNRCRGRVIGVTGSVGKSSTAVMLHQILQAAGLRSWLGGNFGGSLLGSLAAIERDHFVVLELSSFQLHWLQPGVRMPQLAVITNCQPNHLDWHPDFAHYRAAKQRLLAWQQPDAAYILGSSLAEDPRWHGPWPGRHLECGPLPVVAELSMLGRHQQENAALAAAAAAACGCSSSAIGAGLASFKGLPHRLEFVGHFAGRQCIDDSKATTPEATMAALESIEDRSWWLVGGADKGSALEPLVDRLAEHAEGAAFYGATAERLFRLAKQRQPRLACAQCQTLDEALAWCWQRSQPRDFIVLSPACASLDQFRDYAHRGEVFRELCARLASNDQARDESTR